MNLDFTKVCGKHSAIYDAYYKQIDPKGAGTIEAMTGAKFLKKSGLSDIVLSRVWDLADPNGKGYLDKPGFLVALKLVSVAQAGETVNMKNIYMETENPPKVGEIPKIMPSRVQTMPSAPSVVNEDWKMSVIDRLKYEQLFESLKPVGGMLPGNKVKGVLLDSKLPMDTLGKIWDLADQDRDGNLDKHEFLVAMHLVYKTLEKRTVPDVLPPELRKPGSVSGGPPPKPAPPVIAGGGVGGVMPRAPSSDGFADGGFVANFPKDIAPPPAIPPMTRVPPIGAAITTQPLISTDPLIPIGAPPSVTANADWVVTLAEMKRFEVMFRDSDRDKDGLVSGLEVKNVFLQSGVPQNCLAHIWALCDTNQSGKLTLEQFALAMWMVERKQKGIEPPQVLTANMVPPSMRALVSGVDVQQQEPKPTYTNPELEMISKEIEELAKERRALETEIAQKEADIRIKSGEVRSLQSELDTLSATLKQLENQRGEAEKRLDDLKAQVNRIREQCQKQEETITDQEGELNTKRSELQKLKDEEAALQKEYEDNNRELQKLSRHLQNTQLQISSVRSMVTQLMETQRQMTDALLICRAAIDSQNVELVSEYQLKIEPDFDDAKKTLEKQIELPTDDPFNAHQTTEIHKTNNGFTTNGFGSAADQFGANETKKGMTNIGGFDDSFNATSGFESGFDAFGGTNSAFGQPKDPFSSDAFSGAPKINSVTPEPGKDDFGSDPFAVLHAPTGQGQVLSPNTQKSGPPTRPESPSPALPPKKSKVPPPRPAPPRPSQGPARPAQPNMDAFGSSAAGSGFADFADFDNKLSSIPLPLSKSTTTTIQTPTTLPLKTTSHTHNNNLSLFDLTTTANSISYPSLSITSSLSLSSPNVNIATITKTLTNNSQLTRSTTPLPQQISDIVNSNPSTKTGTTLKSKTDSRTKTPIVSGPTDFSDDPFKDYRYDDLCNIQDPFADDDLDPEKIFKDMSSDDETKNSNILKTSTTPRTTSTSQSSNTYDTAKSSEKGLSSEFLNQFDAFNINPSPVPSNKSTASAGGKHTASGMGLITSKSQSTTPLPVGSVVGAVSDIFDNFSDFDAFSTQSTSNNNSNAKSDNNTNNNIGNAPNDVLFDAFSDFYKPTSFTDKNAIEISTSTTTTTTTTHKSNKNEINANAFDDAFGGIGSVVGTANFNNFKNKDPFGEIKITNLTTSKNSFDDEEDDAFGFNKDFNTNIITKERTEAESVTKNLSTVSTAHQLFDDTFEADFFNNTATNLTNINNNNNSNVMLNKQYQSKLATTVNETFNTNFAKFDVFKNEDNTQVFDNVLNNSINSTQFKNADFVDSSTAYATTNSFAKLQNQTVLAKKPNNNHVSSNSSRSSSNNHNNVNMNLSKSLLAHENNTKLADKFASDYSKPETFDVDLEEALKRSMIDQ